MCARHCTRLQVLKMTNTGLLPTITDYWRDGQTITGDEYAAVSRNGMAVDGGDRES